ncbi:MAG: DUF1593 domain-containing protein [Clostridia bacterium]|nr:DUF1593 domain-containing protein [Clostridia bacterium]
MMKEKTRLIVLTDISSLRADRGEPDDTQSLIRLLLYANELQLEGLVATYSAHLEGCDPALIHRVLDVYAQVRPNLVLHDAAYPPAEQLHGVVAAGSPRCGMDQVGEGGDTEGSELIIRTVDRKDPRPVWITVWGAPTDLAQALWKVEHTRSKAEAAAFRAKIRVHAIHDQYDGSGPWIRKTFPDVFYLTSYKVFRGMYRAGDESLSSPEWVRAHVTEGHGPLGAIYPVYDGGDNIGPVKGMKEGDSPSFLYLIPNGLNDPEKPEQGSWGGRFRQTGARQYSDGVESIPGETSERASAARWRQAYQADFAARMDWCVLPYAEGCHSPRVQLETARMITARPGDTVELRVRAEDPDGSELTCSWSQESGVPADVEGRGTWARVIIPEKASGRMDVLFTARKQSDHPLERYARTEIHIK